MKQAQQLERKKDMLIWLFFAVLVFGTLLLTGTITSGFHLVDDHEFITYSMKIGKDGSGLWTCIRETVLGDLDSRFRPLYYLVRVLLTAVFGINLKVWSVFMAIQTVLALNFLYLCAKCMGMDRLYAVFFSLVVMVGPQSAVWWKLGPQENTGMLLFSTGFYLLLRGLKEHRKASLGSAVFLFTMASLYKESFLLLLPFVVLFVWTYEWKVLQWKKESFPDALKAHPILSTFLTALCLLEVLFILFFVNTNSLGYVGFDPSVSIWQYVKIWGVVILRPLKFHTLFAVAACVLLLPSWHNLWKMKTGFLLTLSVMLPQFLLHCKSGIEERYVIPWSFGYALFFVVTVRLFPELKGLRQRIYTGLLCLFLVIQMADVVSEAKYFTYRGKSVTTVMETLAEEAGEDTNILAAYSPYIESDYTISLWMEYHGNPNVYFWDEESKICTDMDGEGMGRQAELTDMDIILFYNPQDRHYLYEPSIDLSGYERTDYGTLVICRKEQP